MEDYYSYPANPHVRRHGPAGYADYESYRPWLEDDFEFRCVYCLKRKVWCPGEIWQIDHLVPSFIKPDWDCEYDNLVLACQLCNSHKGSNLIFDPCHLAYGQLIQIEPDGSVVALNEDGEYMIDVLCLNNPCHKRQRVLITKILNSLKKTDPDEYELLLGLPEELPNLEALKPKANHRPEGIAQSWYARRQRGELP